MGTRRPDPRITLTEANRSALVHMADHCSGRSPRARRARIVLLAAEGWSNAQICQELGCTAQTASCWRRRWLARGLEGMNYARRAIRPPSYVATASGRTFRERTAEQHHGPRRHCPPTPYRDPRP